MEEKRIILLSCGSFERGFLKRISGEVEASFRHPAVTEECHLDISPFYNPARRQYDGDRLLHHIPGCTKSEYTKIIGLFRVDLYIPILTYIFGQAILGQRTAVASVYRLRNELYGMKPDEELLLSRTVKEVVHELGHTFGLIHCRSITCVMRASTYVEEIDLKDSSFCPRCQALLDNQ